MPCKHAQFCLSLIFVYLDAACSLHMYLDRVWTDMDIYIGIIMIIIIEKIIVMVVMIEMMEIGWWH